MLVFWIRLLCVKNYFILDSDQRINAKFVAKEVLFKIPFMGVVGGLAGNVSIKRTDRANAIKSLQDAAHIVRDRKLSICIAPEGTRRRSKSIGDVSQLLPFKKGPFYLTKDSETKMVPVMFTGCRRLTIGSLFRKGIQT